MYKSLLLSSFLLAVPGAASAATIVYNSGPAFDSAAGSTLVEDFDDATLLPGVTVTTTTGSVSGGLFQDRLVPGASTTFNFTSAQSAFGGIFDLSPGGAGLGLSFTLGFLGGGTEIVSQQLANSCTGCFFGFSSTNPFTSVTLNSGTQGGVAETFNLNNLQIAAAVPEPATWALMLIGFGFVGGAMRSSKRQQKLTVSYA